MLNSNLDRFRYYLKDIPSPDTFIHLNYLFCVASSLGRRCWIGSQGFPIYPNLYLVFVGPPAVGKSLPATKSKGLLKSFSYIDPRTQRKLQSVNVHPEAATFESMLQNFQKCTITEKVPYEGGLSVTHTSMVVLLDTELGLFIQESDKDLPSFLINAWDCMDYTKTTKTQGNYNIKVPCLNFMGCCTDDWIDDSLRRKIISSGLTSRIIFAYSNTIKERPLMFETTVEQMQEWDKVREHLFWLSRNISGKLELTQEAFNWLEKLSNERLKSPNNKSKLLTHYYGRRATNLLKLTISTHFSDKTTKTIDLEDAQNANKLLESIEIDMHKALEGAGNANVITLVDKIMDMFNGKPNLFESQIYLQFIKDVKNQTELKEAIELLVSANKISKELVNNRVAYKRV